MHSIPLSTAISGAAAVLAGWVASEYARSKGCSEKDVQKVSRVAKAAAGAATAYAVSAMMLDPIGGHITAAHHTVHLGHHALTLAAKQVSVPVVDVT
jgi:uncharacterized protein YwlG (UPF0340 family)